MNPVSRAFCRVFQAAFHLALPILPYRRPKIYENITGIGPLLRERKVDSVLLITDSTLRSAGITAPASMTAIRRRDKTVFLSLMGYLLYFLFIDRYYYIMLLHFVQSA